MIDLLIIEFYINKKYNQDLNEYFGVTKSCTYLWKKEKLKLKQKKQFISREGFNMDVTPTDLINTLYK